MNLATKRLATELSHSSLSIEAAEDPEIIASRVERIAMLVDREIRSESSRSTTQDEPEAGQSDAISTHEWEEATLEDEVAWVERQRRRTDLRNERMARRINEALAQGGNAFDAVREALRAEGLEPPEVPEPYESQPITSRATEDELFADGEWEPDQVCDSENETEYMEMHANHPAVLLTQELLQKLLTCFPNDGSNSFSKTATSGLLECLGGLAQATSQPFFDRFQRALAISQLRRALRGHAFAVGAISALRSQGSIDESVAKPMTEQLKSLLKHIHALSASAWNEDDQTLL